jgi:amino acid adenylation domain-containing protein
MKEAKIQNIYKLSPMQEGMLFHYIKDKNNYAYCNQMIFSIKGEINIDLIQKSFEKIIERYDILRTIFRYQNVKQPVQIVLLRRKFKLYFEDLHCRKEKEQFLDTFIQNDRRIGYDLTKDLLFRISIFKLNHGYYKLIWSCHHIVMDGWSTGILFKELMEIYQSLGKGKAPQCPTVIPYSKFLKWLEIRDKEACLNYWKRYLDNFEKKTIIPGSYSVIPKKDQDKYDLKEHFFEMNGEFSTCLVKIAKVNNVTVNIVLQTIWGILLQKYNDCNDVVFGAVVSGRPSEIKAVESIVGLFINMIPVRIKTENNDTFVQKIREIQNDAILSENFDYAPIADIQANSSLKNELIGHIVAFQNYPIQEMVTNQDERLDFEVIDFNVYEKSNYDFNVVLALDNFIMIKFIYNSIIFASDSIKKIELHLNEIVRQIVKNPGLYLKEIDIVSYEEKKQILIEFNNTATLYPKDKTIQELFEEQVERTQDNIAVIFEDKQLTYKELNGKANQLARLLRDEGVSPDTIVGLMINRSIEMILGLLGILKSGGSFLPLDPEWPERRIVNILNDSNSNILLTNNKLVNSYSFYNLKRKKETAIRPFLCRNRPQITDLNKLPFPNRSLVNYEKYAKFIGQSLVKNSISLFGSRGCPFNCAYCHKIWPKKQISRSAKNIFEEILIYYNIGFRRFVFLDDIFNLDIKNTTELFEMIINKGLDIQLCLNLRGDILTENYIDLMVKAGVIRIAVALETASSRLQKMIGKNLNIERFKENMEYICSHYPQLILEINTMHGFPTETEEEAVSTLNFIRNLKWVDFPYINILKIYPNTEMEKLALDHGISQKAINESASLAYHELPETLPFEKSFTLKYKAEFLNEYFLKKERLLNVLPYQMKILTEDELVQKYNSYLPIDIKIFDDLLKFTNINKEELKVDSLLQQDIFIVPGLNKKIKQQFPIKQPLKNALKVLFIDLSQFFSNESNMLYDVVEPPLGLMYLMSYLKQQHGENINGKIIKSRIDFDNYSELEKILDEFKPDVIGVRSLTFYRDFFHKTVSKIRQWGIDVPIITGGPYATTSFKSILKDSNIDIAVLGEGEITFNEIITKIIENNFRLPHEKILKNIKGICFIPNRLSKKSSFNREIYTLEDLYKKLPGKSKLNISNVNKSNNLAYIIYTSGTTGLPKGVMIEHVSVNNLVFSLNEKIYKKYNGYLRVAVAAPYFFDASIKQVFGALLLGHTLYIIPENIRKDGELFIHFLRTNKIEISDVTPSHLQLILATINGNDLYLNLKNLLVGGEPLSKKILTDFFVAFKREGLTITNVYGPAECCVDATSYGICKEEVKNLKQIPIGKSLPNVKVYVLDNGNKLVPIGIPGELCISGVGVSRGYLNRPTFTGDKFINNPFACGEKLYKTGDLGRCLPDGNLEFLGRIDHQVKIRGFRIELGEIESHLLRIDGIKEAVVIDRKSDSGDKYLCGYIVYDKAKSLNIKDIRDKLSRYLPDYMIPFYFVQLEKIPLTKNGKIDKSALPNPERNIEGSSTKPGNKIEKKLVEIWKDILGIEEVEIGIDDDFFLIGGHSLLSTVLISRIHKEFNVKIPLEYVFSNSTIRSIAGLIKTTKENQFIPIKPAAKKEYYELSHAQKRLWLIDQYKKDQTAYNISWAFVIEGDLNKGALEDTFNTLLKRHESIRTTFIKVADEPKQKVHEFDSLKFEVEYIDLRNEENKEDRARELAILESKTSFNLEKCPLLRTKLVQIDKKKYIFLFTMHHIISDGWSMNVLINEFFILYNTYNNNSNSKGVSNPLQSLKIQYKDYTVWHNNQLKGEYLKEHRDYWLKQFEDSLPVLNIPTDFKRPDIMTFTGKRMDFILESIIKDNLFKLCQDNGATLFMGLLSIVNILLYKYTNQEDIILGSPIAGREHKDLENQIGFYVNTLPLRTRFKREDNFIGLLKKVKETTLNAYKHQVYPYDSIVKALVNNPPVGRNPIFDVMVVFQNTNFLLLNNREHWGNRENKQNLKIYPFDIKSEVSLFDILFEFHELEDGFGLNVVYNSDLFEELSILIIGKKLLYILKTVLGNPQIPINSIHFDNLIDNQNKKMKKWEVNF